MHGARGAPSADADALIQQALAGRDLTAAELQQIIDHAAQAGFDPNARERAGGRLRGLVWQGQVLSGRTLLRPAEAHYLRHVVAVREWPVETSLQDYVWSIEQVVRDPTSGVFVSEFDGLLQLGIARRSEELRGPQGQEWLLVEYRASRGHWTTAFQPPDGLIYLAEMRRRNLRWLREPV